MAEDYFNQGWFGRHPAIYEIGSFFISPMRSRAARRLKGENLKIIDVATGTGAHAYELAKLGHDVTGIDLDPNMLLKANRKCSNELKLQFLHGDGTKLPFANESFDAATISFAMHDVPHEIAIALLKEMCRVTRKGGEIYIVDYYEPINNLGARLLYWAAQLYESPNYNPFIDTGLAAYAEEAGLQFRQKENFLGMVQFTWIGAKS